MTTVSRPDFIDSPYFVPEPDNWHLKPGAPREVVREFNRFMKVTRDAFTKLPEEEKPEKNITLHEAIKRVINEYGPAAVRDITIKINEQGLYKRKDGKLVSPNQVSARIRKYPHLFIRENGEASLNEKNRMLSIEASVGGYSGSSFQVCIDLENKIATYKNLEGGYEIIGDRELIIEEAAIEKFCSEMESIRILEWEREYLAPILDGTSWSITIKTVGEVFESRGSNAFPRKWRKFCQSIEDIVKREFR